MLTIAAVLVLISAPQQAASSTRSGSDDTSRTALAQRVARAYRPSVMTAVIDRYRATVNLTQLGKTNGTDIAPRTGTDHASLGCRQSGNSPWIF